MPGSTHGWTQARKHARSTHERTTLKRNASDTAVGEQRHKKEKQASRILVVVSVTAQQLTLCAFIYARNEKKEEERRKEEEELEDAMKSVTKKDYNIDDFVPMQPAPTAVSSVFFLLAVNIL